MDHTFCPGAKLLRQPKPEEIECPHCGQEAEIWSDEARTTCPACKGTILRDGSQSCLDWCAYGKDCVGDDVYNRYMKNKALCLKERLFEELGKHFQGNSERVAHAQAVLGFAEELLKDSKGDWHIVVPASILHDVGIGGNRHDRPEGSLQEKEGPSAIRQILLKAGLQARDIDQICQIIAHHHSPGKIDSANFKILHDAHNLAKSHPVR
jgi:hypothetical protein